MNAEILLSNQIKRPRHSKFIQIILEGHVIYKLDTRSSSDVTINQDGSLTLQFRVPQVVLSMQGNYSITLDRGAVVGLGCTSDGPPSPAISSRESWTFDVGVCAKGTFIDHSSYNCNGEIIKSRGMLCRGGSPLFKLHVYSRIAAPN